ncbi:hypothetical protein [Parasegetibacter sp. NRK P23]|uniref:hypothetical protein n=1 Tax=Parasegetibacter sp. NRK P23 TaxID=2942999 RepID=UPI00204478C8|nr:hypothetical protein [Parasegetibacter sp. NRK P23]MCM5530249.1 hypothetical protein [Parasegetibacter sp. NRK P23]
MKFWELTSSFREERDILWQVLMQDKWEKYCDHFKRWDDIIQNQERHILDEVLPFDLCYEVAVKSKKEYWLSFNESPQIIYNFRPDIEYLERLLPSEILIRFGGEKIEDARERSMTEVQPRPLNGNVEVIGSYVLTALGMVAVLRSEHNKIPDNCLLSLSNEMKRWLVKEEFTPLNVDPYSAYKKLEAQRVQNIRHYLIVGVDHFDKPKPGEVMKIIESSN